MVLFCTAIWRDLVSLSSFPFLSHFKVFSREISLVCCLKYPYNFLSSHFCFLVIVLLLFILVLFLVAVIRLSFSFYAVVESALSSMLSISSLGCKRLYALSLVFLFSGPFVEDLQIVHFKKGPEYLTRETAQVFLSLMRFQPYDLVSSTFLLCLRYSF